MEIANAAFFEVKAAVASNLTVYRKVIESRSAATKTNSQAKKTSSKSNPKQRISRSKQETVCA